MITFILPAITTITLLFTSLLSILIFLFYWQHSHSSLSFKSFLFSRILPHRAASRFMRPLSEKYIPVIWRTYIFKTFGKIYPVQWHDFAKDLSVYHTFREFFTRPLERNRVMTDTDLVSPVDGTIVAFGKIDRETQSLEQIKGVRFQLNQLLYGCDTNKNVYQRIHDGNNLYYTIIYLAPGDYHRFHSPADGIKIDCFHHIVGDLFPVKPSWLKSVPGLFTLNERIVMSGTWKQDLYFAYIAVGAFNIGSIHLKHHPFHETNQAHQDSEMWYPKHKEDEAGKKCIGTFESGEEGIYDKGDEVGYFSFGSTVVLIFEAPNFDFHIDRERKIQFGDALGDIGLFV